MHRTVLPLAKKEGLKIQAVADETLIFDSTTDKAYVLNPSAAAVWRACDGRRTVPELALYLNRETPTSEQSVWYALGQLNELLQEPVTIPSGYAAMSRRKFLKRTGLVAAAATVPLVISLAAPPPAAAQSVDSICCECEDEALQLVLTCEQCTLFCISHSGVFACPSVECVGA